MTRPSWDEYFLGIALVVAKRSRDSQTQHGCVLVDDNNHIVGTGYNSFPAGLNDEELPDTRPEKYPWMKHSELNACLNCKGNPVTAYVTGKCCFSCLTNLYQRGVRRVVMLDAPGWKKDDEEKENWERFVKMSGILVEFINPEFTWMPYYTHSLSEPVTWVR